MTQWNDFFKILSLEHGEGKFTATIEFNPEHEIFKGHFPGNPVVPGVCMIQVIKLLLTDIYKKTFTMKEASQLKFLAIINPDENRSVQVDIGILKKDSDKIAVTGTVYKADLVFLKYKATFTSSSELD